MSENFPSVASAASSKKMAGSSTAPSKVDPNVNEQFTYEEVAKHATEDDLWLVLDNQVYDMSKYLHPGGYQVLKDFAGGQADAMEQFVSTGHSKKAIAKMKQLHIGSVITSSQKAEVAAPSDVTFSLNDPQSLMLKGILMVVYLSIFAMMF